MVIQLPLPAGAQEAFAAMLHLSLHVHMDPEGVCNQFTSCWKELRLNRTSPHMCFHCLMTTHEIKKHNLMMSAGSYLLYWVYEL